MTLGRGNGTQDTEARRDCEHFRTQDTGPRRREMKWAMQPSLSQAEDLKYPDVKVVSIKLLSRGVQTLQKGYSVNL